MASFLRKYQRLGKNPFSLSYKLGNDLDYLLKSINRQLTTTIGDRLRTSYEEEAFTIPLPIIAQSVSAAFSGLVMSWFTQFQSVDASQFATFIQRTTGAAIREALRKAP